MCWLGVGQPRSRLTHPEEIHEIATHDVRSPHPRSKITEDRIVRRSTRGPDVPWWIWGRVEARISRASGRSQSFEDVRFQ